MVSSDASGSLAGDESSEGYYADKHYTESAMVPVSMPTFGTFPSADLSVWDTLGRRQALVDGECDSDVHDVEDLQRTDPASTGAALTEAAPAQKKRRSGSRSGRSGRRKTKAERETIAAAEEAGIAAGLRGAELKAHISEAAKAAAAKAVAARAAAALMKKNGGKMGPGSAGKVKTTTTGSKGKAKGSTVRSNASKAPSAVRRSVPQKKVAPAPVSKALSSRKVIRKPVKSKKPAKRGCCLCGATKTPQWRRGPKGPGGEVQQLCNACGVRLQKKRAAR